VGLAGGEVLSNEAKLKTPLAFVVPPNDPGSSIITLLLFWPGDRFLHGNDTKLSHYALAIHQYSTTEVFLPS
jgi:hypothetical protein